MTIAGITAHFDKLKNLLVDNKKKKLVMLTETHLTVDVNITEYSIIGSKMY